MSAADDAPGGLWLADIAANLLCLVVIVLAVAARQSGGPAVETPALPVIEAAPLGAAEMVEALRLRLQPGAVPGMERIDLTAAGIRAAEVPGVVPAPGGPALVYVLDGTHHAGLVAQLRAGGRDWVELDVPEALGDGAGDWNPAFAALAPEAAVPDRWPAALARLLTGPAPARGVAGVQAGGPSRLVMLAQLGLAVLGAALSVGVWLAGRAAARRAV